MDQCWFHNGGGVKCYAPVLISIFLIVINPYRGTGLFLNVNQCQSRQSKYHGRSKCTLWKKKAPNALCITTPFYWTMRTMFALLQQCCNEELSKLQAGKAEYGGKAWAKKKEQFFFFYHPNSDSEAIIMVFILHHQPLPHVPYLCVTHRFHFTIHRFTIQFPSSPPLFSCHLSVSPSLPSSH